MRALVVDDEPKYARLIARVLSDAGHAADVAADAADALKRLAAADYGLLVTDLRMPRMSGLELMAEARRLRPALATILMTAYADVATARQALKGGALDYLVKPFDNAELVALARRACERSGAAPREMIGTSPAMVAARAAIERAAGADAPVLVLGESGTGKELAARALHDLGRRARGPFIDVHIAALPETMIESELFGFERGAFTGADQRKLGLIEMASGGTLFLDEIGELPLAVQPKLLRFLQERRFWRLGGTESIAADARVVAATNRDLAAEVRAGRFREDLFYRLDVLSIRLPPLRERGDDVLQLADRLLVQRGVDPRRLGDEARSAMRAHRWPGNVRELANVIERAVVEAGDGDIAIHGLQGGTPAAGNEVPAGTQVDGEIPLHLRDRERAAILEALARADGNKTRAAEILGITRRRLYSRLQRLGLDPADG